MSSPKCLQDKGLVVRAAGHDLRIKRLLDERLRGPYPALSAVFAFAGCYHFAGFAITCAIGEGTARGPGAAQDDEINVL